MIDPNKHSQRHAQARKAHHAFENKVNNVIKANAELEQKHADLIADQITFASGIIKVIDLHSASIESIPKCLLAMTTKIDWLHLDVHDQAAVAEAIGSLTECQAPDA